MGIAAVSLSLSSVLMVSHVIGGILIAWGSWRLLGGLSGEGQSEEGVALLRGELLGLFKPLLVGTLAVSGLLLLAMWERSPLTQLIQVIAPLSTLVWVGWSHYRAKKLRSGALFEALVPLSMGVSTELNERASAWVQESPPLNARGLMHTAFQAVEDAQGEGAGRRALSVEVTLKVAQDSLRELHEATLRFPLAQQLTLSDWIYEGERLSQRWGAGLSWITRGRALLNPLTLLDYKGLWSWSKGSPAELFQRELASWLHRGLYVLVYKKVTAHLLSTQVEEVFFIEESAEAPALIERPRDASADQQMSEDAERLWRLIAFKVTVPFWLYLGLSGVAAIEGHGALGVLLSASAGLALWWSSREASALESWRAAVVRLATHRREPLPEAGRVSDEVRGVMARLTEQFKGELKTAQTPCMSLLSCAQQSWSELSYTYRRALPELEDPNPILDHLNATLPDLIATLYWLSEDLRRFSESRAGGLLKALSEHLGGGAEQGFEPLLLGALQRWALEGENEQIDPHSQREPHADEEEDALRRAAQRGDQWAQEHIYEAGFLIRAVGVPLLNSAVEGLQSWVSAELSERLQPMYRGVVPALPPAGEELGALTGEE